MEKETQRYNTINLSYSVENYDPKWPEKFQVIKNQLSQIFKDKTVRIEHVGSTSVPDMKAKPVIDVMVEVRSLEDLEVIQEEMKNLGYDYFKEFIAPNSILFLKNEGEERVENIHVFPSGHKNISEQIELRDYLRSHPAKVHEYGELKTDLATKFPTDYISYRKYKDEYVSNLLKEAQEWSRNL